MKNESLTGVFVLINPQLRDDPAEKQGQIGILTYARATHENYVSFPKGGEAIYHAEHLMMLNKKEEILAELMKNGSAMPIPDFKAIYMIMMRQEIGTSSALFNAMEIAKDHPNIWGKALHTLNSSQKIELDNALSR